jgi:FkbM family methyltransferase
MNNFKKALRKKLIQSQYNNFGVENFDEFLFGPFNKENVLSQSSFFKIKNVFKRIIRYRKTPFLKMQNEFLVKYNDGLQRIYEKINSDGQKLLVEIIAFRLLGYKKIKLSRNNNEYWNAIEIGNSLLTSDDTYDPHFLNFILHKCDLKKIGYNIQLYSTGLGVATNFILEQYAFNLCNNTIIDAKKGDFILDLGACWGDTALYFACKTGERGKVYSFEFIPDNIKLFNINISLNSRLKDQIELIQHPVSDRSGEKIYFTNNGPSSRIEFEPFIGQNGQAISISIDDYVKKNSIIKIDFIKMDIEGAESLALMGAIETIKKFKPKLAIAIYHSMDDFVKIPNWITELNLGYKLYLGHYTIHSEETVIFAKVE